MITRDNSQICKSFLISKLSGSSTFSFLIVTSSSHPRRYLLPSKGCHEEIMFLFLLSIIFLNDFFIKQFNNAPINPKSKYKHYYCKNHKH